MPLCSYLPPPSPRSRADLPAISLVLPASITLNDGTVLPSLAFGTGTAIYGKDATAQVVQAIKAGFVHIDCAEGELAVPVDPEGPHLSAELTRRRL